MTKTEKENILKFKIDLDLDLFTSFDEKSAREFIAKLLQQTAQSVLNGGDKEDVGEPNTVSETGSISDKTEGLGSWMFEFTIYVG